MMIKHAVAALVVLVVYAMACFIAADINAFNWPAEGRVFLCVMGILSYIAAVTYPSGGEWG